MARSISLMSPEEGSHSSPNNKEGDPFPFEWGMDPGSTSEEVSLALLNAVDLDQEDSLSTSNLSMVRMDGGTRKRGADDEGNNDHQGMDAGEPTGMLQMPFGHDGFLMETDERPRVSRRRKKKPKGLPKRPMNAYAIFYHQERLRMVEYMTEGSLSEDDIQRQVGKMWRSLSAEQVSRYEKLAEDDKARYHEEMDAYHGIPSSKAPPKNDMRTDLRKQLEEEEEDHQCQEPYDFPPPPPGVTVIPGLPSNGRESVASISASSARRDRSNPASPVPPPISSRWNYQPPPPAMPQMQPRAYASLPPPVSNAHSPPRVGRLVYHGGPYGDYYNPSQGHHHAPAPPLSWGASPLPSWGASPPSPCSPRSAGHYGPPVLTMPPLGNNGGAYSPRVLPSAAYSNAPPPAAYSIPPGMELALPTRNGGEQKFTVTYRCYTMKREDVASFLESLHASGNPGSRPASRSESQPPPRPPSTYSSHQQPPVIQHRPSW